MSSRAGRQELQLEAILLLWEQAKMIPLIINTTPIHRGNTILFVLLGQGAFLTAASSKIKDKRATQRRVNTSRFKLRAVLLVPGREVLGTKSTFRKNLLVKSVKFLAN